jgi:hypothetical protein
VFADSPERPFHQSPSQHKSTTTGKQLAKGPSENTNRKTFLADKVRRSPIFHLPYVPDIRASESLHVERLRRKKKIRDKQLPDEGSSKHNGHKGTGLGRARHKNLTCVDFRPGPKEFL